MDWSTLMKLLDAWLWSAPYLDIPNYAWTASGLGVSTAVLYLLQLLRHKSAAIDEAVQSEPAEAPAPPAPEPAEQPTPEPVPVPEKSVGTPAPTLAPTPPKPEPVKLVPKPEPAPEPEEPIEPPEGFFARLKKGLSKTQSQLVSGLSGIFSSGKVDDETLDELEELLITSDIGVKTSTRLLEGLRKAVKAQGLKSGADVRNHLKTEIAKVLSAVEIPLTIPPDQKPFIIMVSGVNGTGKTTTIGKLAMRFKQEGKSVMLGAADTFRAAAIEQLEVWGRRSGAPVIKHKEGADPSAVAFDAVKAAQARGADVLIIDTAGRLHTKANLMEEVKKVRRIIAREAPGAPHEVLLVLDATTGQNAMQQAKIFNETLEVTGLILTKLDGTAKGGIIVAVSDEFKIPIRFIGVGEKIADLQPFKAGEFVEAVFEE